MKMLTFMCMFLLTSSAFAYEGLMTNEEQIAYVENFAKNLRKSLWRAGYERVESSVVKMTKEALDAHVKSDVNAQYEQPLKADEISKLYSCYYRKNCTLFRVDVYSEMYAGGGAESNFVLLNPYLRKHTKISHSTYVE